MWPEWALSASHEVQVKLLYACVLSKLLRVTTGKGGPLIYLFTQIIGEIKQSAINV